MDNELWIITFVSVGKLQEGKQHMYQIWVRSKRDVSLNVYSRNPLTSWTPVNIASPTSLADFTIPDKFSTIDFQQLMT